MQSEPEFQFICYCKDCRVINSGGHLCGILIDDKHLQTATQTQTYKYEGGSGHPIIMHFCPICSTQLYGYPTQYPGKVVIRANTLEQVDFKPQQALFAESAFNWDKPQK